MKVKGRGTPNHLVREDSRIAIKYRRLFLDFEELVQETVAKKKRLEMLKHQRSNLLAEVKFLRERYCYLMENHSQNKPMRKPRPAKKKTKSDKKQVSLISNQSASGMKQDDSMLKRKKESAPIFDLNEAWEEEKELQLDENAKKLNEMKASVCRNAGNGSNRLGKRRISWQDPVAVRV